jgi:hypothetical protein
VFDWKHPSKRSLQMTPRKVKKMNFKVLRIFLLTLIIFPLPSLCLSEQPDSQKWVFFADNCYYNKNFTKSSNILSVWTYITVTDDFRKETIQDIKKDDFNKSIRYKNYDYIVSLNEFDCTKKRFRMKEFMDCDYDGNILEHITTDNNNWENITPGSSFDKLYEKVCVTRKNPLKKKKI